MSVIKWRDSYNTGVAQFDQEHHKLVALIDVMYGVVRDKKGKEVVEKACADLVAYTLSHFRHEEEAMAAADYPELASHQEEHRRLKEQAQRFQQQISSSFPDGTTELYHFLRNWLVDHIQNSDKKYGPYLGNPQLQ